MTPRRPIRDRETWNRVQEIFDGALDLPEADRERFVSEACGENRELRTAVLDLIRAESEAGDFLEGSADGYAASLMGDDGPAVPEGLPPGTEITPYRIVREIGRGGMGRVYLAERADGQFKQQVALKLIQHPFATPGIHERFLRERQILAALHHPNIARLLDGGMTSDGLPFFAMEYIEGRSITDFAEMEKLPTAERVDLFLDVCHAVAYAQQRMIVHRDLKPSNILVSGERQVKLLDFGIAKLLGTTEDEGLTVLGARPLTPEYAAPEQVRGEEITAATDVFALGYVLHKLLTGRRPDQPVPATGSRNKIPLDLANIVGMATAEEVDRRYQTVAALGEDLARYRAGRPVIARAPSFSYLASRFLRRNALATGAVVAVVLSLGGGLVATTWQARRAERQAERAEQVTGFLVDLFEEADPDQAQGDDATASTILARGVARIETSLADDPELRAKIYTVLGTIQEKRGNYSSAEGMYREALFLGRATLGDGHSSVVSSLADLAGIQYRQSRYPEAESLFTILSTMDGIDPEIRSRAIGNLASTKNQLGETAAAESLYSASIELDRRIYGEEHLEFATSLSNYATFLNELNRYAEAESLYRVTLRIRQAQLPELHSEIALNYHNLAFALDHEGKQTEAEETMRAAVDMRRRLYGEDHPRLAASLRTLANMIQRRGDLDEAETIYLESLAMSRATLGDLHKDVALCINDLAVIAFMRGDLHTARDRFAEALTILEQLLAEDHPTIAVIRGNLGRVALETGDLDQAELAYTELLEAALKKHGEGHSRTAQAMVGMSMLQGERERWDRAREFAARAVDNYRTVHPGESHADIEMAKTYLARALGELGEVGEAESLLRETIAFYAAELPDDHSRSVDARVRLGRVLLQAGRPAEALPLLEAAEPIRVKAYGERDGRTAEVMGLRGECLRRLGRSDEAREVLEAAVQVFTEARGARDLGRRRAAVELSRIPSP